MCKSFCSKQFFSPSFFRIAYNLSEKWNFYIIDFFQVLTYCNFLNFGLIEKYYKKKYSYNHNFNRMWLFNEFVLYFWTLKRCAKFQFNPIIV